MGTIPVDLPRGNHVELKDPWDITEAERKPLRKLMIELGRKRERAAAPGGQSAATPTAPQLAVVSETTTADVTDVELDAIEGYERLVASYFVASWSGPHLDGKPITAETMSELPAPLFAAISDKTGPLLSELFPTAKTETESEAPTTP